MELRVWVDGTQRVVCGVKLTTTCQEIVFALAHATQQAGRFTMIERWRNNERLLSPNEQPLVTLQRWGDRMNEVEFILRKTSSEHQPPPTQPHTERAAANSLPTHQHNQQVPSLTQATPNISAHQDELSRISNNNESVKQSSLTNGQRNGSPNCVATTSQQALLNDRGKTTQENLYHYSSQYNPTRRPQTVLGPLTSSNSALNLGPNFVPNQIGRISNSFRPSLSTSTLPNSTDNMTASPTTSMLRPRYTDDNMLQTGSPSTLHCDPHNGYSIQSENQQFQVQPSQIRAAPQSKNYPHEDLYSTINKKLTNHVPPMVPAKPRLMGPLNNSQQTLTSLKNAQMNYYLANQSPLTMNLNGVRPRNPPGYLEYLESMSNRNSLPPSIMTNMNYLHHNQFVQSNMFPRQIDQHQVYQQNGASPASSSASNCYPTNGQTSRISFGGQNYDIGTPVSNIQNGNSVNTKFVESTGFVINRGSAVNVKLHSNSQSGSLTNTTYENLNNSTHSNSSVSQMGHDMLKVIEEQKRVLINQKNELNRLETDQEYLEAKQNSEQAELINRIEKEIRQLEELWSENQAQIKKLEKQDFESELSHLKSEQVRMESELTSQKCKLSLLDGDLTECQAKIEQLEIELSNSSFGSNESILESEKSIDNNDISIGVELKSTCSELQSNGSSDLNAELNSNSRKSNCSDEEEYEDDSGGDASDDLNTYLPESKLRNSKEVPYVDKRGLISGIRSLKLDKSHPLAVRHSSVQNES